MKRAATWLPASVAFLVPTLFIPISVDAYVLPRASLTLAGGGLLLGAGLLGGRRSLGGLRWPVVGVGLAALLAGLFSTAPAVSLVGTYARYESLPMRLGYLALFCGAVWLGERDRTVVAFLFGCGVASVETLYQAASHTLSRPDGNLGQPNLLGALLAMALPLALARALKTAGPARRGWLGLAGLCAGALVISTSRSGWLGAAAGLTTLAVLLAPPRRLQFVLPAAAALLCVAAAVIVLSPLRGLNQDTGAARLGVWRDSLAVIADRPLVGWGEDTMGLVFGRHQTADWEPGHNFDRAHSMPLDLAASQGALGLIAFAWFIGVWGLGVWRSRRDTAQAGLAGAVAAYLAWSLLNFDWAPATAAFWLLAGAAWPGAPGQASSRRSRLRIAAAVGGAVVGLALAVPPVVADIAYYAGHPFVAATVDPLQARYQAARGDLPGLRRAADLGDPDPGTYVALGDAEKRAGNAAAARIAYRTALQRYPYDTDARQRLAS